MILPTRLRDIFQDRRTPGFQELLNLWSVEDGALVGVDLQYTRLLRITPPDVFYFSAGEITHQGVGLGRLLDTLPEGCTAQLMVRVRWDAAKRLDDFAAAERPGGEMIRFILDARLEGLRTRLYKRVEHYLAITTYPTNKATSSSFTRRLALRTPDYKKDLAAEHGRRLEHLNRAVSAALDALRDARITARALDEYEIYDFLFEKLNPAGAAVAPHPKVRKDLTLRSQLALNACAVHFDRVVLDGYYHRAVNLFVRPGEISAPAMTALFEQIPGDFDASVAVHSLPQEKANKDLSQTATLAAVINGLSLFTRYHEAELQTADADQLQAHIKANFQRLFLMTAHVVLRHTDVRTLGANTDKTVRAFRNLDDSIGVIDDMNHLPLFLATMPGHSHLNSRAHVVSTDAAARFMAMSASWDGCPTPQFMTPTDDEKLLGVDLFDKDELTAKHGLVLGVTGEGKSFLTNALLTSFYSASEDNHVIVIDDGGSYKRLCELLGGQYLEPALDGTYAFNPFIDKTFLADPEDESDFITFMTLLIQLMLRRQELSNHEKTMIQKCVLRAYELAGDRTPIIGDLHKAFQLYEGDEEDKKIARDFYKNLTIWVEGTYSRLFNRQSTFQATSRFLVFDLNRMTDPSIKPVMLAIIKSTIHPKVANKRLRKIIALDEVWKFLADAAGAALVNELYKAGRRFNVACYVVTQSPEDLLSSAVSTAVSQNSTVKWILNIGGGYDKLPLLKLSEEEITAVKNLGKNPERSLYRKVFLRFGNRKAVIRSTASRLEYWLYTTDPNDVNKEAALKEKHPDWSRVDVLRALAEGRA
ncbi:MAG: hypothetical protein A2V88_09210 [Elusimicrobia bacterium RBG_16_66_12]|nr:MAG: hypothetical protein A2V88_09210 [Elusimicrobia bacterium RBG_16_66_12]